MAAHRWTGLLLFLPIAYQRGVAREQSIETNGIRVHVLDHGPADPGVSTLVLAHGLTANAHFFDGLVAEGLAEDLRLLCVDLRGRGFSDKPDTGYAMEDHARDVVGLVRSLGIERYIMGGHSFGGLLTYYMAAHHPAGIDKCVVLDAPSEVDPRIAAQIKPSLARLGVTLPSFAAYIAAVKALPYYDGWWDPRIEGYFRADVEDVPDGVRPRSSEAHISEAVDRVNDIDWPSTVGRVAMPTLLLRATGSFGPPGSPPILSREVAERAIAALPAGELVDIDGNHMTAFFGDGAARAASAIRDFVRRG